MFYSRFSKPFPLYSENSLALERCFSEVCHQSQMRHCCVSVAVLTHTARLLVILGLEVFFSVYL